MKNSAVKLPVVDDSGIVFMFPETEPQVIEKENGSSRGVRPNNKKKGVKSEVDPFEPEDLGKVINYFKDNEMWLYYLLFVVSLNLARRIGDTLSLRWEHFYDPETGRFRERLLDIVEDKTNKFACPPINNAVMDAIALYSEKTGCDPSANGYHDFVFTQLSGNYRGRCITQDGYRKVLKKATAALGIKYNVGTHSTRKTFGMLCMTLHPGDPTAIQMVQKILNHSDEKTTLAYTGQTKRKEKTYFDDVGAYFSEHVLNGKPCEFQSGSPVISLYSEKLWELLNFVYEEGIRNADNPDPMAHADTFDFIRQMIEENTLS